MTPGITVSGDRALPRDAELDLWLAINRRPQTYEGWAGIVEELGDDGDASVVLSGDTAAIWAPLHVSGVAEGDPVAVTFGEDGAVAITAAIQTA